MRHGKGFYTYPDLEKLNEAKANNPNIIIYPRDLDRVSFSGEWEEDAKVRGVMIYRDGRKHEGEFSNDAAHGKGLTKFLDGSVYQGDYKNGYYNGHGTYTEPDGYKYVGSWHGGKEHGVGETRFSDGDIY
jgi:hypothetical protein